MTEFCSRARTSDKTCRAMKDGNCTLLQGCNEGDFSFEDLCMIGSNEDERMMSAEDGHPHCESCGGTGHICLPAGWEDCHCIDNPPPAPIATDNVIAIPACPFCGQSSFYYPTLC